MTLDEAVLRALGWAPDPGTLARYREKAAADLRRDDPYTATDYARFAVKRAQATCQRRRQKRNRSDAA